MPQIKTNELSVVQYLVSKVAEEAGEIAQECGKYLRFGPNDHHPNDPDKVPNYEKLRREYFDLRTTLFALFGQGGLIESPADSSAHIRDKMRRIFEQLWIAYQLGTVEFPENVTPVLNYLPADHPMYKMAKQIHIVEKWQTKMEETKKGNSDKEVQLSEESKLDRLVNKMHMSITDDDMQYRGEGALHTAVENFLKEYLQELDDGQEKQPTLPDLTPKVAETFTDRELQVAGWMYAEMIDRFTHSENLLQVKIPDLIERMYQDLTHKARAEDDGVNYETE